jgi:hypothetical protein
MALKRLSSETMVTITGRLLDPERDRPALEALSLASSLIPAMEAVHDGLLSRQHLSAAIERELAKVLAGMATQDRLHNRKKRAVYNLLTDLAALTDDPVRAAAYLDLRDRLLPLGLMEVRRSYLDHVGDAQRLPSRLDDASRALLASIPTLDGPLEGHVNQWIEAAAELGRLDERRAQLEAQRSTGQDASPRQAYAAKRAWIRMIRSLIKVIEIDPQATPEIKERLLAPIRRAEALAERRAGRGGADDGAGEEPAELPAPADVPGTSPAEPVEAA